MLVEKDLILKRGDSYTFQLAFRDQNDFPLNISGATVYFTMKSKIGLSDNEAEMQIETATHIDEGNGITRVSITPADWGQIEDGKYYYDFQIITSSGIVKTTQEGVVKVTNDITKT